MSNRRSFPVRERSHRQALWSDILTEMAGVAIAGKTLGSQSSFGLAVAESITLIRSRGTAFIHFDPASIADSLAVGLGLGIVTSDAFAIGQTAMPGPLSDAGWDWVWIKELIMGPTFTATEDGTNIGHNLWVDIDSKAMRKMKDNQVLAFVAEIQVVSGGGTVDIGATCRHLFKLS